MYLPQIMMLDHTDTSSIFCPHQDFQSATFFMKIHILSAPVGLYTFFSTTGLHTRKSKSCRMEATYLQTGCLIQLLWKSSQKSAIWAVSHFWHGGQQAKSSHIVQPPRNYPEHGGRQAKSAHIVQPPKVLSQMIPNVFTKPYNGGISTVITGI